MRRRAWLTLRKVYLENLKFILWQQSFDELTDASSCFKWETSDCSRIRLSTPFWWRMWGRWLSTLLCSHPSVLNIDNSPTSLAAAPEFLRDVVVLSTWRWRQLKWLVEDSHSQRDLYPFISHAVSHAASFLGAWGPSPPHRQRLLLFSGVPSDKRKNSEQF